MLGTRKVVGLLFVLGWLSSSLVSAAPVSRPATARLALFQDAARRSGVPLPILAGLAWEQSFLSGHRGEPSIDGGYGLLDLSPRAGHDTLDVAARLVHASPAALRRSDALNLLGGALLLAREARGRSGALPSSLGDWSAAILRFTGMRSAFAARLLLDDLYGRLRHGITAGGLRLAPIPGARPVLAGMIGRHLVVRTDTRSPADYPTALWEPASPRNYTAAHRPRGHRIRYIVIHDTEGSCASAVSSFQDPAAQASAHYIVCLDGTIIQTVRERNIAWHAGNWPINQESIGIEHEGYADGAYYTRAQYLASAALVRYLCQKYGIDPDRNVIFGHENVPAATHTDPGPNWNWSFYMQRVRHDAVGYTAGITAVAVLTTGALAYACPATTCTVLGSANWGEQFAITGEQPGWEAVSYAGRRGWLPADDVAAGSGYLLRTVSAATLRAGPSAGADAIAVVPAGQTYVSMARDGAYWYVAYNHRYGFLAAAAVQSVDCRAGHLSGCLAPSGSGLAVTPDAAPAGLSVTVAGSGLSPNSPVDITSGAVPLGTAETDGSGSFSTVLNLPSNLAAGTIALLAEDEQGGQASGTVLVQPPLGYSPHVKLSAASALAGEVETVRGSGFPPEAAVTVAVGFALASNTTKRVTLHTFSQPDGKLAPVPLTIPAAALPGAYRLRAVVPGATGRTWLTVEGETAITPTPTPSLAPPATPTAIPTLPVQTATPSPTP
ncbi:MAG TPA: N-acetylmuramoyl-L-alanine amidase [Chloroflexota bacterium]|nr:N-acetylmuramoyl-L-alanine amidase [Chloroflexota bacterium]